MSQIVIDFQQLPPKSIVRLVLALVLLLLSINSYFSTEAFLKLDAFWVVLQEIVKIPFAQTAR